MAHASMPPSAAQETSSPSARVRLVRNVDIQGHEAAGFDGCFSTSSMRMSIERVRISKCRIRASRHVRVPMASRHGRRACWMACAGHRDSCRHG